ncbi:MAG: hypothetical protein M1827_002797 [Pycnora praestabilis]|nr:MAG: hypothetical protein M1827_002797 [Pycnora praestabilis]
MLPGVKVGVELLSSVELDKVGRGIDVDDDDGVMVEEEEDKVTELAFQAGVVQEAEVVLVASEELGETATSVEELTGVDTEVGVRVGATLLEAMLGVIVMSTVCTEFDSDLLTTTVWVVGGSVVGSALCVMICVAVSVGPDVDEPPSTATTEYVAARLSNGSQRATKGRDSARRERDDRAMIVEIGVRCMMDISKVFSR